MFRNETDLLTVDTEATVTVIDVSADVLEACVARSADHPVDVANSLATRSIELDMWSMMTAP
jgi:hypothetical protein